VEGFGKADRGQLIMACGTGKTLVSMWISEALRSERTLVLVPSLTLMSQTIHEWTANASDPFDYLAVCSDETVTDRDAMVSHTADLGLPVTTDPVTVAEFAGRPGKRVVFATYHSSPRLADAHGLGAPAFDLVVADEAHRCAGPASGDFATILAEDRIRASKRLFMTATPRYFTNRIKKIAGEADFEVASMDEEHKFGPVLHRLTFGEAIQRDLLSDYIVLVVGVDEGTYRAYVERGELVTPDGEVITDARLLASHIGLAKAMRDYDLRRVVSFHGRVKRAEEFSSFFPAVVKWMPPDQGPSGTIWADYASGEMSSGKRDALLSRLRNLDVGVRGLLSNARCLVEGVDVPSLDGVAFIDPRGSRVDIIQAVGRAIRKSPEKKVGVIVLPVFIAEGDDAEEALESSPFKNVWEVLKALRAHDEVLADELDTLRRRLGEAKTADWKRPGKIVLDVPQRIGVDFARAFDVRLVESLTSSWEYWFGLLSRYVEREGHAWPAPSHIENGNRLGTWVAMQRHQYKRGGIDEERVRRLEALPDWSWLPYADIWEEGFSLLMQYVEREGHCSPPNTHKQNGYRLGQWVGMQRRQYAGGHLDSERILRLESLPEWTWSIRDEAWEKGYAALLSYTQREGHARPSRRLEENGFKLGLWVRNHRVAYKKRELDSERVSRLESLPGWSWSARGTMWDEGLEALQRYVGHKGHARPKSLHTEDGFQLGQWVMNRRIDKRLGRLDRERSRVLEAFPGWSWQARDEGWEKGFALLLQFANRESHARPATNHIEDGFPLGDWVLRQRSRHGKGLRDGKQREQRLESLSGWVWNSLDARWDGALAVLKRFVAREGHARVPQGVIEGGFRLGSWVGNQRERYRAGKLDADRQRKLEELQGWTWEPYEVRWEEAFALLVRYAEREGHARIPQSHREDVLKLGTWVATQRNAYRAGKLDADRKRRLEGLPGWSWGPTGQRDGAAT
jgi:Predicted helicase